MNVAQKILSKVINFKQLTTSASKFESYDPRVVAEGKSSTAKKWKFIFFLVCLPVLGAASFNAYWLTTTTKHERPKFIKYDHLRIRNKRFPWGDGDKTFFHNPKVNALSDGYEEVEHEEIKKPKPPRRAGI